MKREETLYSDLESHYSVEMKKTQMNENHWYQMSSGKVLLNVRETYGHSSKNQENSWEFKSCKKKKQINFLILFYFVFSDDNFASLLYAATPSMFGAQFFIVHFPAVYNISTLSHQNNFTSWLFCSSFNSTRK
jgi:hypothetical protein